MNTAFKMEVHSRYTNFVDGKITVDIDDLHSRELELTIIKEDFTESKVALNKKEAEQLARILLAYAKSLTED